MNRIMRRLQALLPLTALLLTATVASPAPAQAAGGWREGWCRKDEGLAIVVSFSMIKRELWPSPKGYVVRCIIGAKLDPSVDPATRALTAANIPWGGSPNYVNAIFNVGTPTVLGFIRGTGTIDGWDSDSRLDRNDGINGFHWFSAISSISMPPTVNPQFASDAPSVPNPNASPTAPNQKYTPPPLPGKRKTARPADDGHGEPAPNAGPPAAGPGRGEQPAAPPADSARPNNGSSATPAPGTGAAEPPPGEGAPPTSTESPAPSDTATPTPTSTDVFGADKPAAAQGEPTQPDASSTPWAIVGIVAALLVLLAGASYVFLVRRRPSQQS